MIKYMMRSLVAFALLVSTCLTCIISASRLKCYNKGCDLPSLPCDLGDIIPDKGSCSSFLKCMPTGWVPVPCPDGSHFDAVECQCVRAREAICVSCPLPPVTSNHSQCECNCEMTGDSGIVHSPNYPGNYPNNADCSYQISLQSPCSQCKMRLMFQDFHTEEGFDILTVRDGRGTSAPIIDSFSGDVTPEEIISDEEHLFLHFKTDAHVTSTGFHASWLRHIDCNAVYTGSSGIVISPNYPQENYPTNSFCKYVIIAEPPGGIIRLSFDDFGTDRDNDVVSVYDGGSSSSPLIGEFHGFLSDFEVESTGDEMYVLFDSSICCPQRGFHATWEVIRPIVTTEEPVATTESTTVTTTAPVVTTETTTVTPVVTTEEVTCGGHHVGNSGFFNSPKYPEDYPFNQRCIWNIRLGLPSDEGLIALEFIDFHLVLTPDCQRDYVMVCDGGCESGEAYGPFCGTDQLPVFVAINGFYEIIFNSEDGISDTGFIAEWSRI